MYMNPKVTRAILYSCFVIVAVCGAVILFFFPEEFTSVIGRCIYFVAVGFIIAFFIQNMRRR